MDFYLCPPGGSLYKIDVDDARLRRYKIIDSFRPRELDLTVPRRVPVPQFSEILVVEDGTVQFRGYVEKLSKITADRKKYSCRGMEALLQHRYLPRWNYSWTVPEFPAQALTIADLFADHAFQKAIPGGYYTPPGVLFCANSLWPICTDSVVYDHTYIIIKLPGAGSASRIGNAQLYSNGPNGMDPLVARGSLADSGDL